MGCAFVGGQKSARKKIWVFRGSFERLMEGKGLKKNPKWTQCKLRVVGDASSKDDRKTILWPC